MICFACKFVMCYTHERPWHVGLTCDEYNEQAQKQQMEIMDSEKAIENTFRQCPACNVPIEKAHGTCNHMRCKLFPAFISRSFHRELRNGTMSYVLIRICI